MGRRRGRPPSVEYQRVADVAVEALQQDLPVIGTLAEVLDIRAQTARRLLHRARVLGYLGRAPHGPAVAHIYRRTDHEVRWLVCHHCLVRWPCEKAFPSDGEDNAWPTVKR